MQGVCRVGLRILLLLTVIAVLLTSFSQNALGQECELNCSTSNCSPEGVCICNTPSPETLLSGNRNFLGGVFCDTPSVMCDGSNTFYCESGGTCNEIVQGENYTCTCAPGFAGEHCNFAGLLCGDMYCYNGGTCHQGSSAGGSSCGCPKDFLGSDDCSVATPIVEAPAPPPTVVIKSRHMNEWLFPVGVVLAIVLSASFVCGVVLRCYRRRVSKLSQIKFQDLREVQLNEGEDFYNDDEEDPFRDQKNSNGKTVS